MKVIRPIIIDKLKEFFYYMSHALHRIRTMGHVTPFMDYCYCSRRLQRGGTDPQFLYAMLTKLIKTT